MVACGLLNFEKEVSIKTGDIVSMYRIHDTRFKAIPRMSHSSPSSNLLNKSK